MKHIKGRLALIAKAVTFAFVFALGLVGQAFATITLPDTGIDLPGHVTAMTTDLGTTLASIVGAALAFLVVGIGINWIRRNLKKS